MHFKSLINCLLVLCGQHYIQLTSVIFLLIVRYLDGISWSAKQDRFQPRPLHSNQFLTLDALAVDLDLQSLPGSGCKAPTQLLVRNTRTWPPLKGSEHRINKKIYPYVSATRCFCNQDIPGHPSASHQWGHCYGWPASGKCSRRGSSCHCRLRRKPHGQTAPSQWNIVQLTRALVLRDRVLMCGIASSPPWCLDLLWYSLIRSVGVKLALDQTSPTQVKSLVNRWIRCIWVGWDFKWCVRSWVQWSMCTHRLSLGIKSIILLGRSSHTWHPAFVWWCCIQ